MKQDREALRRAERMLDDAVIRTPAATEQTWLQHRDLLRLERQWRCFTEEALRLAKTDPHVQSALRRFTSAPLQERLLQEFIDTVQQSSPAIRERFLQTRDLVQRIAAMPEVPDEAIQPDIRHSVGYPDFSWEKRLFRHSDDPEQSAQRAIEKTYSNVTKEESNLVTLRYRFARDIKWIALAAELASSPIADVSGNGVQQLPSGVRYRFLPQHAALEKVLLNPTAWSKRRQLKDRVYLVDAGGKKFVLKERKTPRHTDTKKGGHIEGNTSAQEIDVAEKFRQEGGGVRDGIAVEWEKPIGFVEFPDGYQCAFFEYQEGIIGDWYDRDHKALGKAVQWFVDRKDQYAAEFAQVQERIPKFYNDQRIEKAFMFRDEIHQYNRPAFKHHPWKWILWYIQTDRDPTIDPTKLPPFRYEDFAFAKACAAMKIASHELGDAIDALGYENSDLDGYAYLEPDARAPVRIFGFDFEYFFPSTDEKPYSRKESLQWSKKEHQSLSDLNRCYRVNHALAYLAIAEMDMEKINDELKQFPDSTEQPA